MNDAKATKQAFGLLYHLTEIFSPGRFRMTQEERKKLITDFLSANAGRSDEDTARMLNMLVESLAYSKLQELLPQVQAQGKAEAPPQPEKKKKHFIKFTKKELDQMNGKFKNMFAHGDKIITYRQKKNGVYEIRFRRQGVDINVSSKDPTILKKKFIEAFNNYIATGSAKPRTMHTVLFNNCALSWLSLKEKTTKETTFREYKRLFEHDIAPAFANKTLAEVDREFIQNFLFRYTEEGKMRTAQKLHLILRCIFDLAASDYKFDSPMEKVVLPRHQSKKGSAFTYEEEKQLIDFCINNPKLSASSALLVLLYTGVRRSELATLRILDENWLECDTSKEKMGNDLVSRKIPITPMLRKVMPHIDFEKAKHTNLNTINTTLKRLFPHHHTHELRYTFITRCNVRVQKGNQKTIASKQPKSNVNPRRDIFPSGLLYRETHIPLRLLYNAIYDII